MRVPFLARAGEALTIALELPSEVLIDIAGTVQFAEPAPDGKKTAIRLRLDGLTEQLRQQLERLVAESRAAAEAGAGRPGRSAEPPVAQPPDVPIDEVVAPPAALDAAQVDADERPAFVALDRELQRLREAAAHEVLGVAWDADVDSIRRAYFALTKHYHPDVFARYRGKAIGQLAQEVFILVNKAYDRMRDAAVAAGAAIVAGPALLPHRGWLADIDDDVGEQKKTPVPGPLPEPPAPRPVVARPGTAPPVVSFSKALSGDSLFGDLDLAAAAAGAAPTPALVDGGEALLAECRQLLRGGEPRQAAERLAQALRDQPRNRKLRALYHVANARVLAAQGDLLQVTAQLQAALAHDRDCAEAREALEAIQRGGAIKDGLFKRWFK
jgi:DnaJ-domain-containing protein 1